MEQRGERGSSAESSRPNASKDNTQLTSLDFSKNASEKVTRRISFNRWE